MPSTAEAARYLGVMPHRPSTANGPAAAQGRAAGSSSTSCQGTKGGRQRSEMWRGATSGLGSARQQLEVLMVNGRRLAWWGSRHGSSSLARQGGCAGAQDGAVLRGTAAQRWRCSRLLAAHRSWGRRAGSSSVQD